MSPEGAELSTSLDRPIASPPARRLAGFVCGEVVELQSVTPDMVALARAWRLLPLLAFRIGQCPGRAERERWMTALAPETSAAVAIDLAVTADACRVLAALQQAGVALLVMKGTALAHTHYPMPHLRPRGDTDILIRSGDRQAADAALTALGYVRPSALTGDTVSHQQQYVGRSASGPWHAMDLHWKTFNPGVFADLFSFAELWPESVPVPALGPGSRTPGPAHTFLMLVLHRVAHHEPGTELLPLYDLHLVASQLSGEEWRLLQDAADDREIAPLCARALGECRALFGTLLPPNAADWVSAHASAPVPARFAPFLRDHRRIVDVVLSDLSAASWRTRARLIREHLFPPAAYMRARHPDAGWRLPYFYACRIVTGVPRWFQRDVYR